MIFRSIDILIKFMQLARLVLCKNSLSGITLVLTCLLSRT